MLQKVGCIFIDVKILIRITNITEYNDFFHLQNWILSKTLKIIFQRNSSSKNNSTITKSPLVSSKKKKKIISPHNFYFKLCFFTFRVESLILIIVISWKSLYARWARTRNSTKFFCSDFKKLLKKKTRISIVHLK